MSMTLLRIITTSFVLVLISCGGGGGSESSPTNTTPPVQNNPPQIESITDVDVVEQANVVISAIASDSDGTISTYLWQQTTGTTVEFESSSTNLSFLSPITTEESTLTFKLTVTDNNGATAEASVIVTVYPTFEGKFINAPLNGISYVGKLTSGEISESGTFTYTSPDIMSPISFSIGEVHLGSASGRSILSVMELVPEAISTNDFRAIDINRFLMSIDDDCNLVNGITISQSTLNEANNVVFSFDNNIEGLDSQTVLNAFLDKSNCADSWITDSYALVAFEEALEKAYQDTSSFTVFTPEGELEPSIIFDSSGEFIQILDGDSTIDELYRVLYSVKDDVLAISIGLDGLPIGVYGTDGTIILFNNLSTGIGDLLIKTAEGDEHIVRIPLSNSAITALLKINELFYDVTPALTNKTRGKSTRHISPFKSSFQQAAKLAKGSTQEFNQKVDKVVSSIKLAKEVIDLNSAINSHPLGKVGGFLAYNKPDVKGSLGDAVFNASLKHSGLSNHEQDAIKIAISGLKCAADVRLYSKLTDCVDVIAQTAKQLAELGKIYNEIQDDKDRIAALQRALDEQAANVGEYAPVVIINSTSIGKKFASNTNFTLSAWVKDANEEIPANNIVWYWDDSEIGRGASITYQHQYNGMYTVKILVTDSTDRTSEALTGIEIGNAIPVVTITEPKKQTYLCGELPINFRGQATDTEDGELTSETFNWVASPHYGAVVGVKLDKYVQIEFPCPAENVFGGRETHFVVLEATDNTGQTGSNTVNITIDNREEEIALELISGEGDYNEGDEVNLLATATYNDEPIYEKNIEWNSNIDGVLGNGLELTISSLSAGDHIITLSAINEDISKELTFNLTITEDLISLILISGEGDYNEGDEVNLSATAIYNDEPIDGNNIEWRSSIDGHLGNGLELALTSLSIGEHQMTLIATNEVISKEVEFIITINPYINLLGRSATSVAFDSACNNSIEGNLTYSFSSSGMTMVGMFMEGVDGAEEGEDNCILKNVNISITASQLKTNYDIPFSCAKYPLCSLQDFNKTISNSTYVHVKNSNFIKYTTTYSDGSSIVEQITIH